MRLFLNPRWLLILMLIILCFSSAYGRRGGGGRGGGGRGSSSRGSSSRGSSSRGSSSGSNASRGTAYDRSRDRGSSSDSNRSPPAPAPKPDPPKPKASVRPYVPSPAPPKPSAPQQPAHNPNYKESPSQPASNPNFKEQSPNQQSPNQPASNPNFRGQNAPGNQQPPPYSPREAPPGYSPVGQQPPHSPGVAPPPYSAGGHQPPYAPGGVAPPPYSAQGPSYNPSMGVPNANYPRQPGAQGVPNANYPRQPGMPHQPDSSYPRPPGYPAAPGGASYPSQGGIPGANYPRQPGGIPGANYPRQPPVAPNTLGARVWQPQSGMPAPSYMNHGGLPTGSNAYQKPLKKKGFLGSLMSMGSSHKVGKQPKYYGSYPSPYGGGLGGFGKHSGGLGGFGKHGGGFSAKSAAMYTILPYMAARQAKNVFRPRFGFMPLFLPNPFHHHHYGYGYGGYGYGGGYGYHNHHYYDVYNDQYVGKCNRPITPKHSNISCNSTHREIDCEARCWEGYRFSENVTTKGNKCWHVTGVWRPAKNFPDCQPICNQTCLNGGSCISPDVCGCPPEYRGPLCEHHFLKCDVRKLAGNIKIRWVCTHTKNGTTCKIKCEEPKEFEKPPPDEYKCTPEGIWTPPEIPLCIEPKKGNVSNNETVSVR